MQFQITLGGVCWAPLRFANPVDGWPHKPLRCPSCGAGDCARGVPTGGLDRWLLVRGRVPYECRCCGKRFRYFDPQVVIRPCTVKESPLCEIAAPER